MKREMILPVLLSFGISLALGPVLIPFLRKVKAGQKEREEGVPSHQKKAGTPTMGGVMFLAAFTAVSLLFRKEGALGPLHNPANLMGINACMKLMPGVPNVAVFDTAFHQTMPPKAYMYGIPKEYYEKYAIRKYGFHGTSHKFVSKRTAEFLGKDYNDLKIIVCHMGNGASLSAVKNGKCVDTSMGLTPLEGVIMGTRSGDIDPAFVEYLCNKENLTVSEVLNILNKKSGMLGMTGISSDYRDVSAAAEAGNQDAINCLEAYAYRIIKYIGSYIAAMGGVDVITFTAGLGENAIPLRETICKAFEFMGLEFDSEANNCRGVEKIITKEGSKITACVIPTNEEIAICEETVELVKGK